MSLRRRATALGLAVASVLPLAGCEKPAPRVTVFSGTESRNIEAACWNEQDAKAEGSCLPRSGQSLPITPGNTIGVSVDRDIAEAGWVIQINDQSLVREPIEDSYYRFTLQEQDFAALAQQDPASGGQALLRVSALTDSGGQPQARGVWAVRLVAS